MFTSLDVSHATCDVSYVTCHMSLVTCHISHVTCHYFFLFRFGLSGEASWLMVCYQQGLPRLVFPNANMEGHNSISKVIENQVI